MKALAEFKAYAASTLLILDLAGTFVFGATGAIAGVKEKLDIFGVIFLSFAAASSGGIIRDVLIGSTPPAAISDWRYFASAVAAGLVIFFWYPRTERLRTLRNHLLVFDAAGLGLFAVVGTQKALGYNLNPAMAALLGTITGIGGGIVRDVLIRQVPIVLQPTEVYAVAALAGAGVVVLGDILDLQPTSTAIAGATLCFAIRIIAIKRGWRLPVARNTVHDRHIADEIAPPAENLPKPADDHHK